jgi:hypothetical protein
MSYIIAFAVSFVYIYLKAWQQINVIKHNIKMVPIVAMMMGLCEVLTIGLVVNESWLMFIPIGLGGGIGCVLSMLVNNNQVRPHK